MVAQIKIDQAGKPAGVAGQAREDLDTGTAVTLLATGGPFAQYLWTFVDKAINDTVTARSAAALATPAAISTSVTPIDLPGTYHVQLVVDSGSGLGALPGDVARITFYAGTPGHAIFGTPNADAAELPRRSIAFQETTEHNVPDAVDGAGNTAGWSREKLRHDATDRRIYLGKAWAHARCGLTGGGASLVRGFNIASVTRIGLGTVDVLFTRTLPDANYVVDPFPRGAAGQCYVDSELATGFRLYRSDVGGSLADLAFGFSVMLGKTG